MNFTHYLPRTERRLRRLQGIINGRPAAILLHGVSIMELEKRVTELGDRDICYCSTGEFWLMDKYILSQINRSLSFNLSGTHPERRREYIIPFLEKREKNMLFSSQRAFDKGGMSELIEKYDRKLLFTRNIPGPGYQEFFEVPSENYPLHFPMINSLSELICLLIIGGASGIVLFGADGGRISQDALYHREPEYDIPDELNLVHDTLQLNISMEALLKRVYKTYNLMPVDIINCSTKSHYSPFRKLSYDETFAWLKESNE